MTSSLSDVSLRSSWRNLGPYSNDAEYAAVFTSAEARVIGLPQAPKGLGRGEDVSKDAYGDQLEIALRNPRDIFPSRPYPFAVAHHDSSFSNLLAFFSKDTRSGRDLNLSRERRKDDARMREGTQGR